MTVEDLPADLAELYRVVFAELGFQPGRRAWRARGEFPAREVGRRLGISGTQALRRYRRLLAVLGAAHPCPTCGHLHMKEENE